MVKVDRIRLVVNRNGLISQTFFFFFFYTSKDELDLDLYTLLNQDLYLESPDLRW